MSEDPSIYYREDIIVAVYVDDILVYCSENQQKDELLSYLQEYYKVQDLGL